MHRISWVEIDGTRYQKGSVVVLESYLSPVFGIIVDIIVRNSDQYYFVCDTVHTVFSSHFHAYEVVKNSVAEFVICSHSALVDHTVLTLYTLPSHSSYFIPMKYHIVENI